MNEIWIKSFENEKYEVSNFGRVKSYNKIKKKKNFVFCYLKPVVNRRGYNMISIGGKLQKLSRLIMKSFYGNSDLQVNHINGIKTDDRLDNLEWVTASENVIHAYKNDLSKKGELHHKSKLKKSDIINIFFDKRSERTIAKEYNISQANVNRIKRKIIWKHIWDSNNYKNINGVNND